MKRQVIAAVVIAALGGFVAYSGQSLKRWIEPNWRLLEAKYSQKSLRFAFRIDHPVSRAGFTVFFGRAVIPETVTVTANGRGLPPACPLLAVGEDILELPAASQCMQVGVQYEVGADLLPDGVGKIQATRIAFGTDNLLLEPRTLGAGVTPEGSYWLYGAWGLLVLGFVGIVATPALSRWLRPGHALILESQLRFLKSDEGYAAQLLYVCDLARTDTGSTAEQMGAALLLDHLLDADLMYQFIEDRCPPGAKTVPGVSEWAGGWTRLYL